VYVPVQVDVRADVWTNAGACAVVRDASTPAVTPDSAMFGLPAYEIGSCWT
jgi:hypothetical protein